MPEVLRVVDRLQDLTKPEHLLVWTLRAIAFGHADCPLLARTYDAACGPAGATALGHYLVLVRHVTQLGRRRLKVHAPGCPCVSPDELALAGVVAAAQASLRSKDERQLRMRLQVLLENEATEAAVFIAQAVGQILHDSAHDLPARWIGPLAHSEPPKLRVVH